MAFRLVFFLAALLLRGAPAQGAVETHSGEISGGDLVTTVVGRGLLMLQQVGHG